MKQHSAHPETVAAAKARLDAATAKHHAVRAGLELASASLEKSKRALSALGIERGRTPEMIAAASSTVAALRKEAASQAKKASDLLDEAESILSSKGGEA